MQQQDATPPPRGVAPGPEALEASCDRLHELGLGRRVILFEAGGNPLLLHEEPVLRDGAYVGRTTSGARGFRTGANLCLANISVPKGEPLADTLKASYEIIVAGTRHPLTPLAKGPYDPGGERMRA